MRKLFSSDGLLDRHKYKAWSETTRERFVASEQRKIGDAQFHASLEGEDIGGITVTRSTFGAHEAAITPQLVRKNRSQDRIAVVLRTSGESITRHHEEENHHRPGDMALIDAAAPYEIRYPAGASGLLFLLPRVRLESALGSARLYAGLRFEGRHAGISLARTFLLELIRVQGGLSPDVAERMMGVGVDLIIAGIAERMAKEPPKSLQGTLIVQRAKAYVEANLHDTTLDPPRLAAALGISLRRLQQLFKERERHVSDWIWQRRLAVAAQRLAHQNQDHLSIGTIAYGCGFLNQAHFSKRFKDYFGISPSEHRRAAQATRMHQAA